MFLCSLNNSAKLYLKHYRCVKRVLKFFIVFSCLLIHIFETFCVTLESLYCYAYYDTFGKPMAKVYRTGNSQFMDLFLEHCKCFDFYTTKNNQTLLQLACADNNINLVKINR